MKKIIYLSIVDISKKNGQGVYALKTLESFISQQTNKYILEIIIPRPSNLKILDNLKFTENEKIHFLSQKKKEKSILWHIWIQVQVLYFLCIIGKVDALIYSLKPMMLAPLLYKKCFQTNIYLLVEGLAKNTVKTITNNFFAKIGLLILQANIKSAKKVYPAYQSAKTWIDNIRKEKSSRVIYCGVDFNAFYPLKQKKTTMLTIGYVGSFRKVHLLKELLKSSKELAIQIILIGDGKEKKSIEEYCVRYPNTKVRFIGIKEQEELKNYFQECDIMWSVTDEKHWGIPIKCFEYLACNKKVLFTKKDDFEFIEKNKFGYVLENTNILAIKTVLEKVLCDYKHNHLKDNSNSRNYIKANNDWNKFAHIILMDIQNDS